MRQADPVHHPTVSHAAHFSPLGPDSTRLSHVAHPDRSGAGDLAVGEELRGDDATGVQQTAAGSDVSLGAGGDPARCGESGAVAGQRRIPQPANQHFRSAPSDDAGVVGKSGAGGHRVGVLLDESASCRYGCLRLPCAPGGPPSYHFAWWDAPQEATWRSRTPGGRYGRLIPRFGPLRCTPCGPQFPATRCYPRGSPPLPPGGSCRCQYRVHRGRVRRSWPSLCS